jgi:Mitochondrial carrier protein.
MYSDFNYNLNFLVAAMVLTYPHVVLRARLQDNRTNLKGNNEKVTLTDMFRRTYEKEGFRGLYSGLRIDLVRCLPANAITFITFEFVKKHLEEIYFPEIPN